MDKGICIVIPAFNEEAVIRGVVKDTFAFFSKHKMKIGIVVVDDCSTDQTAAEVLKTNAILIKHLLNSGAGGATATGLSYARKAGYEVVATMDADGQHLPGDVYKGIKLLRSNQTDLLIGSRLIDSSGMSRTKIIGNKGLSLITKFLFGISVTDSQSGLRIFGSNALRQLRWRSHGYEFCSEMLWRAHQLKLKVDEYPIEAVYTDYSKSKGQSNWNAINIVQSLIKQRILETLE